MAPISKEAAERIYEVAPLVLLQHVLGPYWDVSEILEACSPLSRDISAGCIDVSHGRGATLSIWTVSAWTGGTRSNKSCSGGCIQRYAGTIYHWSNTLRQL